MTNFDYINHLKLETKRLNKVINSYDKNLTDKVISDYFLLVENATKSYQGKILNLENEIKTRC